MVEQRSLMALRLVPAEDGAVLRRSLPNLIDDAVFREAERPLPFSARRTAHAGER